MKIYYSKRRTHNLGNYENVVVQISAEDEVNIIVETKEECFIRLKAFVDYNLEQEISQISKSKTDVITHDKIKNLIINMVRNDDSKRDIIKQYMLSRYNTHKVIDINKEDLVEFKNYLMSL